jgi:hypothetical protein
MVLMAYLAGLATPLAALLGIVGGHWWWAKLRRSEGVSDAPLRLTPQSAPSPAAPAQGRAVQNRVSYASKLGPQRALRGKPRRTG